jgi:hypothetical protein
MKRSFVLVLAFGAAAFGDASAQSKAPDALHYEDYKDVYKQFESLRINMDSLAKSFKGLNFDSIRVHAYGSISGSGSMPNGLTLDGILLDNRSESDGYVYNGTRYYIRNAKPPIEPKEVSPGSNIYRLK